MDKYINNTDLVWNVYLWDILRKLDRFACFRVLQKVTRHYQPA